MHFCRNRYRLTPMTITEIGAAGAAASERVRRNVQILMRLNNTTQAKLAKGIGISRPTIQKRLTDGEWKIGELGRLAAFYGLPETVFSEDPEALLSRLGDLGFKPFSCKAA